MPITNNRSQIISDDEDADDDNGLQRMREKVIDDTSILKQ